LARAPEAGELSHLGHQGDGGHFAHAAQGYGEAWGNCQIGEGKGQLHGNQVLTRGWRRNRADDTLKPIIKLFRDEGVQCLSCERLNLDRESFVDYRDSDEHPAEVAFERPPMRTSRRRVAEPGFVLPPILRYFLDGSRRTYKVADVIVNGRYLPIIAGQVGVAVLERPEEGPSLQPMRRFCRFKRVLAVPLSEEDVQHLSSVLEAHGTGFEVYRYETTRDADPIDLGIAKIMKEMHDLEVRIVLEMAEEHLLRNDRVMVIDGPLRFKNPFDIVQFRNVIGISKTFRPTFSLGKGYKRQDVGTMAAKLAFGDRTSVFRMKDDQRVIGMWYLRLRRPSMMSNPLQGVVKVESFAIEPEEIEDGLSADRIDIISSHILRERNVTPYKTDPRWASHLYPIYLAESFIKASFVSDIRFKSLF